MNVRMKFYVQELERLSVFRRIEVQIVESDVLLVDLKRTRYEQVVLCHRAN